MHLHIARLDLGVLSVYGGFLYAFEHHRHPFSSLCCTLNIQADQHTNTTYKDRFVSHLAVPEALSTLHPSMSFTCSEHCLCTARHVLLGGCRSMLPLQT